MSDAPERIWAQDAEPSACYFIGGGWWDDDIGSVQYPHTVEYIREDLYEAERAENARLETEAKLQAEEIDKTRRRADKWQSMVLDCEEYLKFGETPAERIQREINDCLSLMKFLEKKQRRIEELEAKLAKTVEALERIELSTDTREQGAIAMATLTALQETDK